MVALEKEEPLVVGLDKVEDMVGKVALEVVLLHHLLKTSIDGSDG